VIYQEQVLKALAEIGGLPVGRVHELRKVISQKLGEAQFNASSADWVDGAVRLHGIDRDVAYHMWGRLVTSASYSFNLPHCVSYSMLGFWCMWLKIHYPVAFYTAALRKAAEDHWPTLIKDAQRHGITVAGVDAAHSGINWEPHGEKRILAGWLQVPGVGPAKASAILDYRDDMSRLGGTLTLDTLPNVKGIGPSIMGKIKAMDPADPFGLERVTKLLRRVRVAVADGDLPLPLATHTSDDILDAKPGAQVVWYGLVRLKEYKDFIEDERARTGDDLDEIKARMQDPHLPTGCVMHCYDDGDEDVYVRIHRKIFPRFRRDLEAIRLDYSIICAIAKKSRNSFGASIYVDKLYFFDPQE
jgi:DNA polymerase-3 subunit alpha